MEIGRHDPCPCGSGRKYKACCLGRPGPRQERHPGLAEATTELKELLRGRTFASLAEVQDEQRALGLRLWNTVTW